MSEKEINEIENNELVVIPAINCTYNNASLVVVNYQAIKEAIQNYVKKYENVLILNEDEISTMKNILASLRKKRTQIDTERKEIKKEILAQFNVGESQFQDLAKTFDTAIENIDSQLKAFEEKRKSEKLEYVKSIFESIENKPQFIPFEKVFDETFLNKTSTDSKIKEEMEIRITKIENDIQVLKQVILNETEFAYALNYYLKDFDLNATIANYRETSKTIDNLQAKKEVDKAIEKEDSKKYRLAFAIEATKKQVEELQSFLNNHKIRFVQIKNNQLISETLKGEN